MNPRIKQGRYPQNRNPERATLETSQWKVIVRLHWWWSMPWPDRERATGRLHGLRPWMITCIPPGFPGIHANRRQRCCAHARGLAWVSARYWSQYCLGTVKSVVTNPTHGALEIHSVLFYFSNSVSVEMECMTAAKFMVHGISRGFKVLLSWDLKLVWYLSIWPKPGDSPFPPDSPFFLRWSSLRGTSIMYNILWTWLWALDHAQLLLPTLRWLPRYMIFYIFFDLPSTLGRDAMEGVQELSI